MSGPYMNSVERRASKRPSRQYVSETHDHKPDAPRKRFYTAEEVAREFCGVCPDVFYRTREERHTRDLLPRPYQQRPMRFHRASMDAWQAQFHPLRPDLPANDVIAPPVPADEIEAARRRFASEYYRRTA